MKGIITTMISIYFAACLQAQDLNDVRKDFNKGVKDSDLCEKYYIYLKENAKSELEKGYEAAFQMFMAKHIKNPIRKMSYFNRGKKLLESQIDLDSNNVELRFIRLCIQYHIPKYLGYKSNIEDDKKFLLDNLFSLRDEDTKRILYVYLKGANIYSEEELIILNR